MLPRISSGCALILHGQQQKTTEHHGIETIGYIAGLCRFVNGRVCSGDSCLIVCSVNQTGMFTSLTNRSKFGATYTWAILSVLPMDNGDDGITQDGMRPTDINVALGMPNDARTGLAILLKSMANQGLIKRHKLGPQWVEYTRLMPLRKRERIARWIRGV